MDEQAQLTKLRRLILRKIARFGGAGLIRRLPKSDAERAALTLRNCSKVSQGNPVTTFAIPLVGAHQVTDWSVIEQTLARALKALIAQSNPNWRAVICSQTRPDAVLLDPRITHLQFDATLKGHDKIPKLQAAAQYALSTAPMAGFFMPLDGDDLLHRDFVADLHARPETGLLVCSGYIVNAGNGRVGITHTRSLGTLGQKPFWKFCGSCMALPVGAAQSEEADFFTALAVHEHRLYPYLAELAGYTLNYCEAPRALYVINHGENFETRRGRGGFKKRFVERFAITGEAQLAEILEDFPGSEALISLHKDDL